MTHPGVLRVGKRKRISPLDEPAEAQYSLSGREGVTSSRVDEHDHRADPNRQLAFAWMADPNRNELDPLKLAQKRRMAASTQIVELLETTQMDVCEKAGTVARKAVHNRVRTGLCGSDPASFP